MVFSSITFLLYFAPVFFAVYYMLPGRLRNGWLIISSLAFFSWGAPVFIFTLLGSCVVDYWCAGRFHSVHGKKYLVFSIVFNLLLLAYFKYANFFIDNFNYISSQLTGNTFSFAHILLPVGISFLTFHKISFLTDVYRRECSHPDKFSHYLLYILLFPHLIAGPIVRFREIFPQILNRVGKDSGAEIYHGLVQFVTGLSKKVLIANVLGEYVNTAVDSGHDAWGFTGSWVVMLAYSFQLYFDFSGYSDMAIGMARMLGFTFPENFRFPYTSKSITEFWQRWHITLGSWMRDYLYIPMGGNRHGTAATYRNLLVVFFLSGLWHGASWNFVIWGMFHGFFLVAERVILMKYLEKIPSAFNGMYTFIVVVTGWVFFRIEAPADAVEIIRNMFSPGVPDTDLLSGLNPKFVLVLFLAAFFSFQPVKLQEWWVSLYTAPHRRMAVNILLAVLTPLLFAFNLGELFATGFNPFIYFKF